MEEKGTINFDSESFQVPLRDFSKNRNKTLLYTWLYYFAAFVARFNILYSNLEHFGDHSATFFKIGGVLEIDEVFKAISAFQRSLICIGLLLYGLACLAILLSYLNVTEVWIPRMIRDRHERLVYFICKSSLIVTMMTSAIFLLYVNCNSNDGIDKLNKSENFMCLKYSDYSLIFALLALLSNLATTYVTHKIRHILFSKEFNEIQSAPQKYLLEILIYIVGIFHRTGKYALVPDEYTGIYIGGISIVFVGVYLNTKLNRQTISKVQQKELMTHCFLIASFQLIFWGIILDYTNLKNKNIFDGTSKKYFIGLIVFVMVLKLHLNFIMIEDNYERILETLKRTRISKQSGYEILNSLHQLLTGLDASTDPPCIQLKAHKLWVNILANHSKTCDKVLCFCREKRKEGAHLQVCRKGISLVDDVLHQILKTHEADSDFLEQYIIYILDIVGNYGYAIDLIKGKSARTLCKIQYLKQKAFIAKFRTLIDHYRQTRHFRKPFLALEEVTERDENTELLILTNDYFDLMDKTEKQVIFVTNSQIKFFEGILENKDFKRCYDLSIIYCNEVLRLRRFISELLDMTQGLHPYPNMLLLYYFSRIKYNLKMTISTLKRVKEIKHTKGLSYIFKRSGLDSIGLSKPVVLAIGNERDTFHKILYLSGFVKRYLGYSKSDLRGQDLSMLLPSELKQAHRELLASDSIFEGSLEKSKKRRVYCFDAFKHLRLADIVVGICLLNDAGLVFLGLLEFNDANLEGELLIMMNKDGVVTEGNDLATKIIQIPTRISSLNSNLASFFPTMSTIFERYLHIQNLNSISLEALIKNKNDILFWKIYLRWRQGHYIYINTKEKNTQLKVIIKIEDFKFGRGNAKHFCWIAKMRVITNHEIEDFRGFETSHRSDGGFILKLQSIFENQNKEDSKSVLLQDEILGTSWLDNSSEKTPIIQRTTKEANLLKNSLFRTESIINQPKEISKVISAAQVGFSALSNFAQNMKSFFASKSLLLEEPLPKKNLERSKKLIGKRQISSFFESAENENNHVQMTRLSQRFHSSKKMINNKNAQFDIDPNDSNKHYTFLKNGEKYKEQAGLLSSFKRRMKHSSVFVFVLLATSIYLTTVSIGCIYKNTRYSTTSQELLHQSSTLYYFIGTLMASQFPVIGMEMCRMLREGIYKNSDFLKYGVEDSYEHCDRYFKLGGTSLDFYQNIFARVNSLYYPHLIDSEVLICDDFDYTMYRYDDKKQVEFYSMPINLREAMTLNSGFTRAFVKRNYSIDNIPPIHNTKYKNRNEDPDEQMFRDNLVGRFNEHIDEKLHMFSDYLILIAKMNEAVLYRDYLLNMILTLAYSIFMTGLFSYLIYSFSKQYGEFLNIKDSVARKKLISLQELKDNLLMFFYDKECKESLILSLPSESIKDDGEDKGGLYKQNGKKKLRGMANFASSIPTRKGFRFYIDNLARVFLVLIGIFILINTSRYIYKRNIAKSTTRLVRLMITSVDTWNHYFNINGAAIQIILWNNTAHVWGADAHSTFLEVLLPPIENEILSVFDESLSYDLGSFTDDYKRYMLIENPCGVIILKDKPELCKTLYDGILNQGFYKILKELLLLCKDLVLRWEVSDRSWRESENLMHSSYVLSTMTQYPRIMSDFFEWVYEKVNNNLEAVSEKELHEKIALSIYTEVGINISIFLILLLLIMKGLKNALKKSLCVLDVLQVDVLTESRVVFRTKQ